jgi:hypothetical protein
MKNIELSAEEMDLIKKFYQTKLEAAEKYII